MASRFPATETAPLPSVRDAEQYRTLFQQAPQPMWLWDIDTFQILDVNDAAVQHYGYSRDEFLAMSVLHIRPEADVAAFKKRMEELREEPRYAQEWRHRKKDGTVIDVKVTAQKMFFADRYVRLVVVEDITQRKKAERDLALSEARLRLALEASKTNTDVTEQQQTQEGLRKSYQELAEGSTAALRKTMAHLAEQAKFLDLANDAIFVRTADDTISYWNKGAERLYGWTAEEALGMSPHELLATEFPVPVSEIFSRDRWEGELRQSTRGGTKITVASRWTTLRDPEGKPKGWLEINSDITARKQAQDAARRLSARLMRLEDEERRRFARHLHDSLGQYLTALKINIDLAAHSDALSREQRIALLSQSSEIVDRCLVETRTVSHLLHPPLLDEAGLASAVRWYVDGFGQRSGIKVNLELSPTLPRMPDDIEIALFRALQECLTNVHRHSESSAVDISLSSDSGRVTLRVKDYGHGIPEDRLKGFVESITDVGVGLAGMRERIRDLDGVLDIRSTSGEGTRVIVSIPLPEKVPHPADASAA